jgi:L-rhamnose mutarotase
MQKKSVTSQNALSGRGAERLGEVMPANPDNSPVSSELKNVFWLE